MLPRSPLEESAWKLRDEELRRVLGDDRYQDICAAAQSTTLDEAVERVLAKATESAVTA